MTAPSPSLVSSRPGSIKALTLLLIAQLLAIGGMFAHYAFAMQDGVGLRILAVALILFAVFTMGSVWLKKPWALWATMALVSVKLTIDLFSWTAGVNHPLLLLSQVINAAIILIIFSQTTLASSKVTLPDKLFFGCVLLLAGWVGSWGIFIPAQVDIALPFKVPPLHARFLGAMYFSGATFMILSIFARSWAEIRVVVPMISIWTGILGIVSMFHLEAFSWSRTQVWVWFFAYICFPIIAAWIAWRQRSQTEHSTGPALSIALRTYLYFQGAVATLLALGLLFGPQAMMAAWPWKISPILAHAYSAPFLSYGLGSFYAAKQRTWAEVRIVVYATLVFALLVSIASYIHVQLFKFGTLSASLWFGAFAFATLALALFGSVPALRQKPQITSGK